MGIFPQLSDCLKLPCCTWCLEVQCRPGAVSCTDLASVVPATPGHCGQSAALPDTDTTHAQQQKPSPQQQKEQEQEQEQEQE
jgi:hypothetical protein